MTWLVTGGAGYVGAHIVRAMLAEGREVIVLDDLSTGNASRVADAPMLVGSVRDRSLVRDVLRRYSVHGIVHAAAKKQVAESVTDPVLYYRENVGGLVALLQCCQDVGVRNLVFSSSAATYGMPETNPVTEDAPCRPLSPYGETKLLGEWLIRSCANAWGLHAICLRYFNVAGAAAPELGEFGGSNLIPLVFEALGGGRRPQVFGADYPTPDGTAVRDYIHVVDVADAHLGAARRLEDGAPSGTYNIGRGAGCSVLEVLARIAEVTGIEVHPELVARRAGDPARVVAGVGRIRAELGVSASRDLLSMVASAWAAWQYRHR